MSASELKTAEELAEELIDKWEKQLRPDKTFVGCSDYIALGDLIAAAITAERSSTDEALAELRRERERAELERAKTEKLVKQVETVVAFYHPDDVAATTHNIAQLRVAIEEFAELTNKS